jgi:hypothetical protein
MWWGNEEDNKTLYVRHQHQILVPGHQIKQAITESSGYKDYH